MEAAVDWRKVNEILGTHFRVWLVGRVQQLIHILCQLQVAVALCLREGRKGGGYVEKTKEWKAQDRLCLGKQSEELGERRKERN